MKSLVIIFSMFLALNVTAKTQMPDEDYFSINLDYVILENEIFDLEQIVFEDFYNIVEDVKVSDINVVELEEDIEINFDTKKYLPERFNAYKGMHDIDWNTVKLVELEEDVELESNNQNSLPEIKCKSNTNSIIVSRL
jgi:hypothetical protein